ncbi:MAG TPA: hypothetical protein ENK09_06520 [Nitrospirae bacterium]|nr:hypothetical protein [Nitrospirota bacterium]
MRMVSQGIDTEKFFRYYLVKTCDESRVDLRERFLQIEYLSKLLSRFVEPKKHYEDEGELVRIIDLLKEEVEKAEVSIEAYKTAADKILFYQSFFPEAFKRRLLDIKFYADAARAFYRIVGHYRFPVCGLISQEYSLWNFILKSTRIRYLF